MRHVELTKTFSSGWTWKIFSIELQLLSGFGLMRCERYWLLKVMREGWALYANQSISCPRVRVFRKLKFIAPEFLSETKAHENLNARNLSGWVVCINLIVVSRFRSNFKVFFLRAATNGSQFGVWNVNLKFTFATSNFSVLIDEE